MSGTHGVDLLLEVSSHFRLVNKKKFDDHHIEIISSENHRTNQKWVLIDQIQAAEHLKNNPIKDNHNDPKR